MLVFALAFLLILVVLPTLALIVASFRRFLFIYDAASLYDLCFFFSSRRRHTRCLSDWSSDVCSSDLATIAARSRLTNRLPRKDSGTSPATIRWARPSTIAVLPTPGSPMRTGLFFVRRAKIGRASCRERV